MYQVLGSVSVCNDQRLSQVCCELHRLQCRPRQLRSVPIPEASTISSLLELESYETHLWFDYSLSSRLDFVQYSSFGPVMFWTQEILRSTIWHLLNEMKGVLEHCTSSEPFLRLNCQTRNTIWMVVELAATFIEQVVNPHIKNISFAHIAAHDLYGKRSPHSD